MDDVNAAPDFGDYVAKSLLGENDTTRTWLAEQSSVGRMVLIEELKPGAMVSKEGFLAEVRAKAAVEHPLVGSIYEAFTEGDSCYFAQELLPGDTLAELVKKERVFPAGHFAHIVRKISEANLYHESHDNATSPLSLGSVYMDAQGVVRVRNLVITGTRSAEDSRRDLVKMGHDLVDLLDHSKPGATRCLAVLSWMRGHDVSEPIGWAQVWEYFGQIQQQLAGPSKGIAPATRVLGTRKSKTLVWVIAAVLFGLLAAVFLLPSPEKEEVEVPEKQRWVNVATAAYRTPDGFEFRVSEYDLATTETTIGEYGEFLESLAILERDGSERIYDHREQPEEKRSHLPDDWELLYEAAKTKTVWNDEEMDLDHPVVGVDWWDAYAYAKWKRGFLPTQEQWLGALMASGDEPSDIPVSQWVSVEDETLDQTVSGLLGMAGSVSEWTAEPRANPANPLGDELWVIIGGSYLTPGKGATTRVFTANRSMRRPDLGFRIARETEE